MNSSTFAVTQSNSGVGYWFFIPQDEDFKLTAVKSEGAGEASILEGNYPNPRTLYDWDVSLRGATTYRYYLKGADGKYALDSEWAIEPQGIYDWNPLNWSGFSAAQDPRDALKVFLSARLSYRASRGELPIRNPNNSVVFPVKRSFAFEPGELPVAALSYSSGTGNAADIGTGMNVQELQVKVDVAASTPEELDATMRVLREMRHEMEVFFQPMSVINVAYGNFHDYLISVEPQMYGASITFAVTAYTYQLESDANSSWTLLPFEKIYGVPSAYDGGAVYAAKSTDSPWRIFERVLVEQESLFPSR